MARKKASSRVGRVQQSRSRAGSAWDSVFLGEQSYGPETHPTAAPRRYDRRMPEYGENLQEAQFGVNDRDLLPYQPTPTINPGRPRTLAAGYDENAMTMRVKFREGEIYEYYDVPPSVWWKFERAQSPGRFINSTLNNYPYHRGLGGQ